MSGLWTWLKFLQEQNTFNYESNMYKTYLRAPNLKKKDTQLGGLWSQAFWKGVIVVKNQLSPKKIMLTTSEANGAFFVHSQTIGSVFLVILIGIDNFTRQFH